MPGDPKKLITTKTNAFQGLHEILTSKTRYDAILCIGVTLPIGVKIRRKSIHSLHGYGSQVWYSLGPREPLIRSVKIYFCRTGLLGASAFLVL